MNSTDSSPFPQMRYYEEMPNGLFPPYAMLSNPSSYTSEVVNTDSLGFRKEVQLGKEVSVEKLLPIKCEVNLLVGGSTAFGVGASSDESTVSSYLSKMTNEYWLNCGVRGAVSFQEIIHLINHYERFYKIKRIVFLSGINDIYRNLMDSAESSFDKRFQFNQEMLSYFSPKRIAFAFFSSLFKGRSAYDELADLGVAPIDSTNSEFDSVRSIEALKLIYKRNFSLYKSLFLTKSIECYYFLQPFQPLNKQILSSTEERAIRRTESAQSQTDWLAVKGRMVEYHPEITRCMKQYAKESNVSYSDFNGVHFLETESHFVDTVHLSDLGNELVARKIYGSI